MYQYFHRTLFTQDLEGYLDINDQNNAFEVVGGLCQDFFEFREVAEPYQYTMNMHLNMVTQ